MVFGLTTVGLVHTVLGLVALGTGVASLVRHGEIVPSGSLGRTYLATTLVTAVTSLAIFRHGGPGPAHALAVLTLLALGAALAASLRGWRRVQTVALSATMLFHVIPGVTETLTRLPASGPVFASQTEPALKAIHGLLLVAFLVGVVLQLRRKNATSTVH